MRMKNGKHAPCQAKEPTRRHEAITPGFFCVRVGILLVEAFLHSDALGPEELSTVYDQPGNIIMVIPAKIISDKTQPWKMTEEENDNNDDEDAGKIHLIVGLAVPVGSHVGILYSLQMINLFL